MTPVLLALSGGGYRAMLFHAGALWRLNQIGKLRQLTHVSSVSGGSIAAGVLAAHWNDLDFDGNGVARNFEQQIVDPLKKLANHSIDWKAVLIGLVPFRSAATELARYYRKYLFGDKMLADLPSTPTFIFNATSLQTGAIWNFRKDQMGDDVLGVILNPKISLAKVVAASSAFPPFLSPMRIPLADAAWQPPPPAGLVHYRDLSVRPSDVDHARLQEFRRRVVLIDGGVGDNIGVASLWRLPGELLLSDGGGSTKARPSPRGDWLMQALRVMSLIHDQPSQLRTSTAIAQFAAHDSGNVALSQRGDGAAWNMRWPPESHKEETFPVGLRLNFLSLNRAEIVHLSTIRTALYAMNEATKQRLINWGYIAANRSLPYLRHLWGQGSSVFDETVLPYPDAPLGPGSAAAPRSQAVATQ